MSRRLRATNRVLRLSVPKILSGVQDVAKARTRFEASAAFWFRPVPFTRHIVRPGGLHWISSGPSRPGKAILYFHGGGYIVGSPWTHAPMLARLSRLAGVEVCAPVYRLAPETPFPGAFEDACAAWRRLRALGYASRDIVVGGDSAGGGLALALLAHLCQSGEPPAAAFALSPWTDLALTGDSLRRNAGTDALLPVARIAELARHAVSVEAAHDPRISPLYAEFPDCPPVMLHYSMTEILADDTLRMADRLRRFGADVQVEALEDAPHVWHLLDGIIPEARDSLRRLARFVAQSLDDSKR